VSGHRVPRGGFDLGWQVKELRYLLEIPLGEPCEVDKVVVIEDSEVNSLSRRW
jgi:hypothetical protein